jgi:hypothetical protein
MNATTTLTPIQCSHCGELRYDLTADGQHIVPGRSEHDEKRCYTIAHALVADRGVNGLVATEADHHVAELARWLQAHPKQRGTRQYQDREISLDRWIAKTQLIANA